MNRKSIRKCTVLLAAVVVAMGMVMADIAQAEVIGFYTFEGGNANDSSSQGNNGTVYGAPTFVTSGGHDAGDYCKFVGNSSDYIEIPLYLDPHVAGTNYTVDNYPRLTVGGWFWTDVTESPVSNPSTVAIDTDNGGYDRPGLGFTTWTDGNPRWSAWTGYGTQTHDFAGGPTVAGNDGKWVFMAAVYDNPRQQGTFYFDMNDGNGLQRIDDQTLAGYGSQANTYIGGIGNRAWVGGVDDVFFLDEAVTQTQIEAIHNDTKATIGSWTSTPPTEPDRALIQTWDFESGTYDGWTLVPGSTNPEGSAYANAFGDTPYGGNSGAYSENKQGTYYVETYFGNSGGNTSWGMGILETDSFVLGEDAKISFLMNGGGGARWYEGWDPDTILATRDATANQSLWLEAATLERLVDTGTDPLDPSDDNWEVIRDAAGFWDGDMIEVIWDGLEAYEGETVRIRIYDLSESGNWGLVTADNFRYEAVVPEPASLILLLAGSLLVLPFSRNRA